jgi:hypothetical protein
MHLLTGGDSDPVPKLSPRARIVLALSQGPASVREVADRSEATGDRLAESVIRYWLTDKRCANPIAVRPARNGRGRYALVAERVPA